MCLCLSTAKNCVFVCVLMGLANPMVFCRLSLTPIHWHVSLCLQATWKLPLSDIYWLVDNEWYPLQSLLAIPNQPSTTIIPRNPMFHDGDPHIKVLWKFHHCPIKKKKLDYPLMDEIFPLITSIYSGSSLKSFPVFHGDVHDGFFTWARTWPKDLGLESACGNKTWGVHRPTIAEFNRQEADGPQLRTWPFISLHSKGWKFAWKDVIVGQGCHVLSLFGCPPISHIPRHSQGPENP